MLLEKLRTRSREESGFTLVELLVVMLILGILAAIAIPAFFSQRDKANDSNAKASVKTAQTAIESFATDNGGSYATADLGKLQLIEPTIKSNVAVSGQAAKTYILTATSTTGNKFLISRAADGSVSYDCTVTGGNASAGCPTSLKWAP